MTPPPVDLPGAARPAEPATSVKPWRRVDSVVLAVYLAVAGVKLAFHPMWRDELQSWDLARTSTTFGDLLGRVRYEQHPPLWYLLLWVWSRVYGDPRMLQILAFGLVAATAIFVLRLAPWPRPLRWLLLAGYYPLFEWSTLARPYLLTFLLALVGAELVRRRRAGLPLGAVLAALILTDDAYGSILAVALLAASVAGGRIGAARTKGGSHEPTSPPPADPAWARIAARLRSSPRGTAAAMTAAALAVAALTDVPPRDYGGPTLGLSWRGVEAAVRSPAHALLPLPDVETEFWNTYLLDAAGIVVVTLLGAAAVVAVARALRHDRRARALWVLGVLGTAGVQAVTDLPYARFVGTTVVVLVCAFWVHAEVPTAGQQRLLTALAVVLGLQVPGGLIALAETSIHPFSQAQAAGAAVATLPGTVVAVRDEAAVPVAAYAGRRLELADGHPPSTFVTWDQEHLCAGRRCTPPQLLADATYQAQVDAYAGPVYVLTDFEIPPGTSSFLLLSAWKGAVVNEEDYWLYAYEP